MSLQNYFDNYRVRVSGGALCEGDDCCGWHLSDVDTWHECPCNRAKDPPNPHPEDYDPADYEDPK